MRFTRRVCGLENEFGVVIQQKDGTLVSAKKHRYGEAIHVRHIENSILARDANGHYRAWHSNGGSTYVDTGSHPEYNTPECIHLYDALCYNKAGEQICRIMFNNNNPDDSRFLLFKNNRGYDPNLIIPETGTYGCHENYTVKNYGNTEYNKIQKLQQFIPTIPFFATRQIFDGSGWWDNRGNFYLSQRACAMTQPFSYVSTSDRGILQLKTGDTGSDMRLHVIIGDANICEFALYLKIGATKLVLDLLESRLCPTFVCINPIEALKDLCYSHDPTMPLFKMSDQTKMTALDIQTAYFDAVRAQLSSADFDDESIEQEVNTTMQFWEQMLCAIARHDDEVMRGRIDHVTKHYIANQFISRKKSLNYAEARLLKKNIDIHYHNISNPSLQQQMNALWHERRILCQEDIEDATINPPYNTRAAMRGKFITTLINKGITHVHQMDWDRLFIDEDNTFNMPFGAVPYEKGFYEFLEKISSKAKRNDEFSTLI